MILTPKDLAAVEAASKRERAHYNENRVVAFGISVVCYCDACKADREVIAQYTPEILRLLRDWMREPRRGSTDFGDLD